MRRAMVTAGAALLLGAGTGALGCEDRGAAAAPPDAGHAAPAPTAPGDAGLPPAPRETERRIELDPEAPRPGEAFVIRAGPLTFRNGCEGVDGVEVERDGERIRVRWRPREVPPDAMCTMALHDEWVTAEVPGLPAGRYLVVVDQVGRRSLRVGP